MVRLFSGKKKKNHQYQCISQRAHCKAMQSLLLFPTNPTSVRTEKRALFSNCLILQSTVLLPEN